MLWVERNINHTQLGTHTSTSEFISADTCVYEEGKTRYVLLNISDQTGSLISINGYIFMNSLLSCTIYLHLALILYIEREYIN